MTYRLTWPIATLSDEPLADLAPHRVADRHSGADRSASPIDIAADVWIERRLPQLLGDR
jgi:hypothetical protein